jgi:NTE family protein
MTPAAGSDMPSARAGGRALFAPALALLSLLGGLSGPPASGAEAGAERAAPSARPRIGLVLGGGGARGSAHVGVLKVLEELHIPIDYIAGNSMGAIVGGLYAAGYTPDEIARELKTIDWDDTFNDDPPRPDRSFRRKRDDDNYLVKYRLGYSDNEAKVPLALIHGQKFDLHLSRLTLRAGQIHDFNKLPTPFRAVAADIETGKEVVLQSGNLARSIRASMAVPGAFDPVEIDGRLLVDGLVVNNVPVNVARDMGANVLIVVDVGSGLYKREELKGVLGVVGQLSNILSQRNVDMQLASLKPNDIYIQPKLGKLGAGDFNKAAEGIEKGEQAAREMIPVLKRLAMDPAKFKQFMAKREVATQRPVVDFVRLENRSRLGDELIRERLTLKVGEPLDTAQLERDIGEVYGLDVFESVRYEIVQEEGQTGVVVHATEKSWGPNYLQFGLELADNFEGDSSYNLGLSYLRTGINRLNGEIRLGLQIGQEPGVAAEWHQPLDPLSRYFTSVKGIMARQNFSQFDGDGNVIADYRVWRAGVDLAAGREFGTWGEGRVGYRRFAGEAEVRVGDPGLADYEFDLAQAYLRLSEDKFDNSYFPRTGSRSSVEYASAREGYGSDSDFDQLRLRYAQAFPWGRNTLLAGVRYETTLDGDAPIESRFRAGGFLRLSGFRPNELSGQHYGQVTLAYYRLLTDLKLLSTYAGFSLEYGNVWQDKDRIFDDALYAGSVFLGVRSPLGPVYTGLGFAEGGRRTAFLYLGPTF